MRNTFGDVAALFNQKDFEQKKPQLFFNIAKTL